MSYEDQSLHSSSSDDHTNVGGDMTHDEFQASAPPSEDNGFYVVPNSENTHHDKASTDSMHESQNKDDINKMLADISNSADVSLNKMSQKVLAEADSSTNASAQIVTPQETEQAKKPDTQTNKKEGKSSSECAICPYYALGCNYLSQVQVPPKVKDLLLWSDPKYTGAIFGSSLVLLISLASFSLLTVISSLFLLAISTIGAYRFYLAVIFRIKGTEDKTFEKLSKLNVSLPKDKIQELAQLLDSDVNRLLNQLKSILLWDSVLTSCIAFGGFYFVYCVGCIFNTLTLMILALVSMFTLPKVYQVYKVQIDQGLEKATGIVHGLVKQLMVKVPFLNKKKTQ